jgi:hypothetical protein
MIRHPNHSGPVDGDTRVQFHNDCKRLLVVNARLFAIYNWKLECSIMVSPVKFRQSFNIHVLIQILLL